MTEELDENGIADLPENVQKDLLSFYQENESGELEPTDLPGLAGYIAKHGETYPALLSILGEEEVEMIRRCEEVLLKQFQESGELPPGVEITRIESDDNGNVMASETFRGPLSTKS